MRSMIYTNGVVWCAVLVAVLRSTSVLYLHSLFGNVFKLLLGGGWGLVMWALEWECGVVIWLTFVTTIAEMHLFMTIGRFP